MERTTAFSAVLVINIFSITDSADHDNITRHVKQDSIVAHAQAIRVFGVVQVLDVAMQSVFQPFDLAENLNAFARANHPGHPKRKGRIRFDSDGRSLRGNRFFPKAWYKFMTIYTPVGNTHNIF